MKDTVLKQLNSKGAIHRARGILQCIVNKTVSEDEAAAIRLLTEDQVRVGGRTVGDHALAALHILGLQQYTGNNEVVIDLIKQLPQSASWILGIKV